MLLGLQRAGAVEMAHQVGAGIDVRLRQPRPPLSHPACAAHWSNPLLMWGAGEPRGCSQSQGPEPGRKQMGEGAGKTENQQLIPA